MWVLDVESESMSLHLMQGQWTLGRSGNVFNFPKDKSISRNHAEFQVGGLSDLENVAELPSFVLMDKKSRFGTYLNDVQISPNTPMPLRAGDKISFGAKSTILRVRYFKMVARTSRIQKANRKKLLDGCMAIGMHVVTAAVEDVNYCITDPGKFVATEKVLWAMVHNHPIVSSEWVQAILRRKSMAEELPSCEEFLPQHDASSATEEKNQPSYASDPRRFSLYRNYLVVFLTPSSMEALLPVMGGEVYPAYASHENDEYLVDHLRRSSRDHVLIVYPSGGSSADGGGASEKQQPSTHQTKQTSSLQSLSKPGGANPYEWDPVVLRQLHHLQAAQFALVLHQELAASIIFTKPPTTMSDETVSQLMGPTMNQAASASFPSGRGADGDGTIEESANASVEETPQPRHLRDEVQPVPSLPPAVPSTATLDVPPRSSKESLPSHRDQGEPQTSVKAMDVQRDKRSSTTAATAAAGEQGNIHPSSTEAADDWVGETHYSSKTECTGLGSSVHSRKSHRTPASIQACTTLRTPAPAPPEDPAPPETSPRRAPQGPEPPMHPIASDQTVNMSIDSVWRRKPVKRTFGENRRAPAENPNDEDAEVCIGAAIVYEALVIRRPSPPVVEDEDVTAHVRYLPRHTTFLPPPPSTKYNAKKFRKSHVVTMSARRRLVTHFTNVVPVNLEHRREFAKQDEELEARERVAEALFASNMPGTNKTGSRSRR